MPNQTRMNRNHRRIIRRIIIQGDLILTTPTCLSNGDAEGLTDMALLRDSITNHALLTGASIAGALRNYLWEYQNGYASREGQTATQLFGSIRSDDNGDQSPLIVYDAISNQPPDIELRDGVSIDSKTGTAKPKAKYDMELLAAGTLFPLQFELLIDETFLKDDPKDDPKYVENLLQALAITLQGLEQEQIHIGMKKRRGFGRCHVEKWKVWDFNLKDTSDLAAWLAFDRAWRQQKPPVTDTIRQALKLQKLHEDQRNRFTIHAEFKLEGSLLIRSSQAERDETGKIRKAPDSVHLKSRRGGELKPVLSGTSLAGVLRHRAERIVFTLNSDAQFVDEIFGIVDEENKIAQSSRLLVHETVIKNTADLVQNRIAIDRFTGGAYHGALFDEQPVFGGDSSIVTLSLELRQPQNAEIGLLLLLLKDLWTSDLPVGGGSSIGRGRLQGRSATITHQTATQRTIWIITQNGQTLEVNNPNNPETLEQFVEVFVEKINRRQTA
jgi:CRISPR/Cas system CSM-associated protein Csm3 (group 7 of RAMP superfamily)